MPLKIKRWAAGGHFVPPQPALGPKIAGPQRDILDSWQAFKAEHEVPCLEGTVFVRIGRRLVASSSHATFKLMRTIARAAATLCMCQYAGRNKKSPDSRAHIAR